MAATALQLDLLLVLYPGSLVADELLDTLAELRGRAVPVATLYRQLDRAVDRGWIAFEQERDDDSGPGRPRRRYRITPRGTTRLREGVRLQRRWLNRARSAGLIGDSGR